MSQSPTANRARVTAHTSALRELARRHRDEFQQIHARVRSDAGLPPVRQTLVRGMRGAS